MSNAHLEFAPVEGDPRQAVEEQSRQKWLESGKSLGKFVRSTRNLFTFEILKQTAVSRRKRITADRNQVKSLI